MQLFVFSPKHHFPFYYAVVDPEYEIFTCLLPRWAEGARIPRKTSTAFGTLWTILTSRSNGSYLPLFGETPDNCSTNTVSNGERMKHCISKRPWMVTYTRVFYLSVLSTAGENATFPLWNILSYSNSLTVSIIFTAIHSVWEINWIKQFPDLPDTSEWVTTHFIVSSLKFINTLLILLSGARISLVNLN